jgi:arsenical pump membrane protein
VLLVILPTYAVLRWTQRGALTGAEIATDAEASALSGTGKIAGFGIVATAGVLIGASALGLKLGLPTFLAGLATALVVLTIKRGGLVEIVGDISWGVLPLVAGLFVLVEALEKTGVLATLADLLTGC